MSTEDSTELTVTVEGITVTKSYEPDEFPVPAIAFDVRSDREERAELRLVDTVPDDVPPEDLGFHPDYDSDHWSVEDSTAVFERRFEPGERFRTVYGIRNADTGHEGFMTEPALDVRESDDATETTDDTREEADEAATPRPDTTPGASDLTSDDTPVSGRSDDGAAEEVDSLGSADATDGTGATSVAGPDGVAAALAAELRDGTLRESDRELLSRELAGHRGGSDVRISHLQARISDLEAYTDALEDFIDDNGSARQLVEDLTDRLDAIESDFAAVKDQTTQNEVTIEELDTVDDQTTQNEADIEALHDRITRNEADIEALDKGIADTSAEVAETRESVAEVRDDVAEINDWRARISNVFGGVTEDD